MVIIGKLRYSEFSYRKDRQTETEELSLLIRMIDVVTYLLNAYPLSQGPSNHCPLAKSSLFLQIKFY